MTWNKNEVQSLRVVHVITTIERGGAELQLLQAARSLKELGVDSSIVYLKGKPELYLPFKELGAELIDLSSISLLSKVLNLRKYLRKRKARIIHAHLPRSEVISYLARLCTGTKLIITRHNSEAFWPEMPRVLSSFISRIISRKASKVIVISNAVLSFLVKNRELNSSSLKNVRLIYYGFSDIKIVPRKKKIATVEIKVGTIARLEPQKNLTDLLRAVALVKEYSNVSLQFVGEGSERLKLGNLSKSLSLENVVKFLGKTDLVQEFLQSLNVFVLPSKYEGFGAVLVEAMQANVPVVASNTSSIPEVLGSNYPALFEVGDFREMASLILRLKDKTFNDFCTSFYSKQLQKFSAELMAKELLETYQETLSR
jgi:glycosyltransferase involved in cell wall biosynthesis